VYRLWCGKTLYQILAKSGNPRRNYCNFNIWPACRVCRMWSTIIFTKFGLCQPLRSWLIEFLCSWYVISRYDLDLWPRDIGCIKFSRSRSQSILQIWAKSNNFRLSYWPFTNFCPPHPHVTLWPYLWTLDLESLCYIRCHVITVNSKCERNRTIRGWVIDDLAHLRSPILVSGALSPAVSRVRGSNVPKRGKDIGRLLLLTHFVHSFDILLHFQTRVAHGSVMSKIVPNFTLFDLQTCEN